MVALETPALAPSTRQTLLDVANVIEGTNPYLLQNATDYETAFTAPNILTIPAAGVDKQFQERGDDTTVKVFTAYLGLDDPLLRGVNAGAAELEALFEAGESLYVEDRVQELLLNDLAVDITPTAGTPVTSLKQALGLLEQWIAERYLYRPTISGNLYATYLIPELVRNDDGSLTSLHGSPIAAAAGFGADGPGIASAAEGTAWLYISGQINVWKGQAAVSNAQDLPLNRDLSLVEKFYAASIDGPVAAILVGT